MKHWRGWVLPDGEEHVQQWMGTRNDIRHGRPTYQAHKYDAALSLVKGCRVAIDVGANVGLWSWLMSRDFAQVHAFEPVPQYAECWHYNVLARNTCMHQVALGAQPGMARMVCRTVGSCGDTTIDAGQGGAEVAQDVEIRTLDSYNLHGVDLIKADNEGYEMFVMRGGAETIRRCRPVVIVEQKPGHGAVFGHSDTAAVEFLHGLGMTTRQVISGDYILSF